MRSATEAPTREAQAQRHTVRIGRVYGARTVARRNAPHARNAHSGAVSGAHFGGNAGYAHSVARD
jgi:hypothetical protein